MGFLDGQFIRHKGPHGVKVAYIDPDGRSIRRIGPHGVKIAYLDTDNKSIKKIGPHGVRVGYIDGQFIRQPGPSGVKAGYIEGSASTVAKAALATTVLGLAGSAEDARSEDQDAVASDEVDPNPVDAE